jgi:hypothetical protein
MVLSRCTLRDRDSAFDDPLQEIGTALEGGVADVVGIRGWRSLRLNQTTKTGVEAPVETTP